MGAPSALELRVAAALVALALGLATGAVACGGDRVAATPDLGRDRDLGADLGPDFGADLGADARDGGGDDAEPDAGFDWDASIITVAADPQRLAIGERAEITCTVTARGASAPDRTRVTFEVVRGEGWLIADGLTQVERSTVDGVARAEFIAVDGGVTTVRALLERPDRTILQASVALTVTGERVDAVLTLEPDLPEDRVFAAGSRRLPLVATFLDDEGAPAQGVDIDFDTSAGLLVADPDGTPARTSATATTDDLGRATVYFEPGAFRGSVTFAAEVDDDAWPDVPPASATITVVDAGTLEFLGIEPSRLTVSGAVHTPTGDYAFVLRDRDGVPVADHSVEVALATRIDASTDRRVLTTDDEGVARGVVRSGELAGAYQIVARATLEDVEVSGASPRLFVSSGLPVTAHSRITCTPNNVGGLFPETDEGLPSPPRTTCTVELRDRQNLPLQVPTRVFFDAELGTIEGPETSDESGRLEVVWTLEGETLAVSPIDDGRDLEPAFDDGDGGVANVRDQVARIIFYADGEELFTDDNGDGVRQGGEAFWDYAEPFVDRDDSGFREGGEPFVDAGWGFDDSYDLGNERYDARTVVWGEAVVTLSGPASFAEAVGPGGAADRPTFSFWRDTGAALDVGEPLRVRDGGRGFPELVLADTSGAPLNPSGEVRFRLVGCGDALTLESDPVLPVPDRLGFDLVSLQSPLTAVGWSHRSALIGFEPGAIVDAELRNPIGGAGVECTLEAEVRFGPCPGCDDTGEEVVTTSLSVIAN